MTKRIFSIAIGLLVLPLLAAAQDCLPTKEHTQPAFTLDVGLDTDPLHYGGNQMLSPWGRHYRGEYGRDMGFHGQFNYVTRKLDTWGLRFAGYGVQGDYRLEDGRRSSEDVAIYYVAPQYGYMVPMFRRMTFSLTVGAGYLHYRNDGLLETAPFEVVSHQLGANAGLSVDWKLNSNTAIGCRYDVLTSLYGQRKQQFTIDGATHMLATDKWNALQVSQMDLSFYVRVYIDRKRE